MKQKRNSMKKRSVAIILTAIIAISVIELTASYLLYSNTMDTHFKNTAKNMVQTECYTCNKDDIKSLADETLRIYNQVKAKHGGAISKEDIESEEAANNYYREFDSIYDLEVYKRVHEEMYNVAFVNEVNCMYVCAIDWDTNTVIYMADGTVSGEECETGTFEAIEPSNLELIHNGIFDLPAYITNYKEYGWLCTAAEFIKDDSDNIIGIVYVDISMNDVMMDRFYFFLILAVVLVIVTVIFAISVVKVTSKYVVGPVKRLSEAAINYTSNSEKSEETIFDKIDINTNDELEDLSCAMVKMENDINNYIDNLTKVTKEKERIGAELNVATSIQANMLPRIFPPFPEKKEINLYATMHPAKEVGGDFYDFFLIDDEHVALVMADVSGKGVPAALFMVIAKTMIKNRALMGGTPAEILSHVNNQLCESNDAEMFVTVWLGILNIKTGVMTAANAGHEFPAIKRAGEAYELFKDRHGFVLAGMEGTRYRDYEIQLNPGDMLYVYTDGVAEATDANNELFGTDRMLEALNLNKEADCYEILANVRTKLDEFVKEAPQFDDITMLCLKYYGEQGK